MKEVIIEALQVFPKPLATILFAMIPIGETRAAIPVAIEAWNIKPGLAFIYALIGNIGVFFPLYFGLEWVRDVLEKHAPKITQIIDKQIARAHRRVQKKYEQYGAAALFLFTAVPLPFTGVWTATLAAIALKIPFKYTFPAICAGAICAAGIVTAITLGVRVI